MTNIAALLKRNEGFATTEDRLHVPPIPFLTRLRSFVITCVDPRVDPAAFLGVELGDAVVLRNIGGRVTRAAIEDVAYISYLLETKAPDGPWFEVAVVHHTECGSQFLADGEFRHDFVEKTGFDEGRLAETPVLTPAETVRTDVEKLRAAPEINDEVAVSGHVYDLESGLVTTVVSP